MLAARSGYEECVRILSLYEAGLADAEGRTALMWAAKTGHLRCVEALLEREKGMKDKAGRTALYYAAEGPTESHRACA